MAIDIFQELLNGPARLRRRAAPVSGDLRISWGVAIVLLIVGSSRGGRCSFQKLHFLGHAVRRSESRDHALGLLKPGRKPRFPMMRVEPWLNRAVNFAASLDLLAIEGGKSIRLTKESEKVLIKLKGPDLLVEEKQFLEEIRPFATEKNIDQAMIPRSLL